MFQKHYLTSGIEENHESTQAWNIGLTFATEASPNFTNPPPVIWTSKTSKNTLVPVSSDIGWYIFNIQSTGK